MGGPHKKKWGLVVAKKFPMSLKCASISRDVKTKGRPNNFKTKNKISNIKSYMGGQIAERSKSSLSSSRRSAFPKLGFVNFTCGTQVLFFP